MSDIISMNQLERLDNDVYCLPGNDTKDFGYSDGQSVEKYLGKVFSEVSDLSSRSAELQSKIIDWPSEYHLTSDRSNLLRGFDLSFARNALELGSGCGAISRYLGEQGLIVDAIEGSPVRAGLGRMRCRGLDNVRVISANYNELDVPRGHYDLVLFVGVIEYAHRFKPDSASDREAALSILRQAKELLTPEGVVIVAIENRLGLKYILGHHEDHYSKRYVGIHGYKDSAGIATYSEEEWRSMIGEVGFEHHDFSYPFPDYKIPRVMLTRRYVEDNPYAFNHLEGLFARDYTMPAKRSPTESVAWEAASSGHFLHTVANSFCILMGNTQSIEQAMNFDFCHAPGPGRKPGYAVLTRKLKDRDVVTKTPLLSDGVASQHGLEQILDDQTYLRGNLLSTEWLRAILIYVRRDEFDELLRYYYAYLGERDAAGEPLEIDLLPINIVVGDRGQYQVFDQEWQVDWEISREYLLFRALLTFIVSNWIHMKEFLGWLELYTVRDFIDYGFRTNRLRLAQYLDDFMEKENRFQQLIAVNGDDQKVEQLLETTFDYDIDGRRVYSRCYWRNDDQEGFAESDFVEVAVTPGPEIQTIRFALPDSIKSIGAIRFDPFDIRKTDKIGFFSLTKIELIELDGETEKARWRLDEPSAIAEKARSVNAAFEQGNGISVWMAMTDFPKLEFDPGETLTGSGRFEVRVGFGLGESSAYQFAHQRYLTKIRQSEQTEKDLKDTLHHLDSARREIAEIKSGRPFRLGMKIFSILSKFKR